MVKDSCIMCNGVSPDRCTSGSHRKDSAFNKALMEPRPIAVSQQLRTSQRERASRISRDNNNASWGPVLQNREHFLELHLR